MREAVWVAGVCLMVGIVWLCLCLPITQKHATLTKKRSLCYAVCITLLAALLYVPFSAMPALRAYWKSTKEQHEAELLLKRMPSKQAVIDRLENLLKRDPNRPKGWALLGRIRLSQGKLSDALRAYQQAWQLTPNNLSYAIGLGEATLLAAKPLPSALLKQYQTALQGKIATVQKAALYNLLAISAYRNKHYQQAIHWWEQALPFYPPGSEDERQLLRMIHKAQEAV